MGLKRYIKFTALQRAWRKKNAHNTTKMENIFDINCVEVGRGTYGGIFVLNHNVGNKLSIGSYCSIAPGVAFVLNSDHNLKTVSTFPFKVKILKNEMFEAVSKGNILVGDDVWIGLNAIVLSGVHIGQGAVIAAGAVVTKDVPPYAIVAGNPARIIKKRFSEEIILKLLTLDYGKIDAQNIKRNIEYLYNEITQDNVDKILSLLPDNSIESRE